MRKLTHYGPSLIVLVTALVVLVAGPNAVHQLTHAYTSARVIQASERLQGDNVLEQINQAYRDIATFVEPSVVHISAQRPAIGPRGLGASLSSGSGWVYDELGHIVTNFHVVEDAERIDVQLYNGETRSAEIVGFDRLTDIAVLKIEPGRLHAATRVDTRRMVSQGEMVFAFGSPFDFRFSMSAGVVSGIGRFAGVIRDQFGRRVGYENFIQVDAAINPGNSGGPLTDFRGHVIGMNTAIATGPRRGGDRDEGQFSGIGLAIPIDMIEPVVSQLVTTGEVQKGFLGVSVVDREMTIKDEFRDLNFDVWGVMIGRLDRDSTDLREHFRTGDVIVAVDGDQVFSPDEFSRRLLDAEPAESLRFSIWRIDPETGRAVRLEATLPAAIARQLASASLLDFREPVARRFEARGFSGQGVPVVMVDQNGPAGDAGLQRDDLITHINGQPVLQRRQVQSMISSLMPGDIAELQIWRYDPQTDRGTTMTINVKLGRLDLLRARGVISPSRDREQIEPLGIGRMSTMTRELARQFDIPYRPGVLLEQVVPGSALSQQIAPGAVIIRVRDQSVTNVDQLINVLSRIDLLNDPAVQIVVANPDGSTATARLVLE